MVSGPPEMFRSEVMFVIEGTAINGAYLNDLKTGYIAPTLEHFRGEEAAEDAGGGQCLFGVVVYKASDCPPQPPAYSLGPFASPAKLLQQLDSLELAGGRGEAHANLAEGLAATLGCFDELKQMRQDDDDDAKVKRHALLVASSPPYLAPTQEFHHYSGNTVDQLAQIYSERNISLSVISPRKIPALFRLFEKAGGDLSVSQTKNYAKDPRHLVLLKGFCLKERPLSPVQANSTNLPSPQQQPQQNNSEMLNNYMVAAAAAVAINNKMPINNQLQPNANQFRATQNQTLINRGLSPQQQQQHLINNTNQQQFQVQGPPPGYHPTQQHQAAARGPRWMGPNPRPGFPGPQNNQPSALLTQLSSPPQPPPHPSINYMQMNQGITAQQMRMQQMMGQQQQQQQQNNPNNQQMQQNVNQQQQQPQQQQQNQVTQMGQQNPVPATSTPTPTPNLATSGGRTFIWQGVLEWTEKGRNPTEQKLTRHVPCSVSANCRDGEPELKADSWPQKLIMQLMPKQLIGNIGGHYLKDSKSVLFHPQQNEALESLTKVMVNGFAGCVHFTPLPPASCDIKVLILLYTPDKKAYLGFIPNNQGTFVERLKKVIQQQKLSHISKQGQGTPGAPNLQETPTSQPQTSHQSNLMMSQTNTMAMGGGQLAQPGNAQLQPKLPTQMQNIQGTTMGISPNNVQQQQQQRAQYGNSGSGGGNQYGLEAARQQNLDKILELQATLEAAQQQEAQYKSQMEIINNVRQIQDSLHFAQQQEHQFKQMEAQMMQMGRAGNASNQSTGPMNQNSSMMVQNQVNMGQNQGQVQMGMVQNAAMNQNQGRGMMAQTGTPTPQVPAGPMGGTPGNRMMRPVMGSNPGLRHLLQQQPQYRPGGGLGGQRAPPPQQQSQQFDDSSFDLF